MAIKTEDLSYQDGATRCIGILAYDAARTGRKPGVVVFHEAGGISPNVERRTRMLAELGYVALAADMFGERWQAKAMGEGRERLQQFRDDPALARTRAKAALSVLAAHPQVDAGKLFAIGFCFGGTVALELARAGEPLLGVFSFHGTLESKAPAQKGAVKASIVVCQGAEDPWVPLAQRQALEQEMRTAEVADWQLIVYGNTEHNFTTPDAEISTIPGLRYNELSDRRAWRTMCEFFEERLVGT